jgi:foldase protein PrsA
MRLLALFCVAAALLAGPARAEEDREIVSVNGTMIRQSEVMDRLWKRYGPATLDEMVDEILLRQAAQSKGLKPDEAEVDKRISRLKAQFSDPALFENQLQQSGSSLAKLRAEIADQFLIRKLIVSTQKVVVTEDELKKVFQEQRQKLGTPPSVHLRHLLVKTKAEADEVMAKIKAGTDFGTLARERSLAPTGKLNGGDYGFVTRGMLPDEIEQIAFSMKTGELRAVPSPKGFHVLQITGKKPAQPAQYEKVKDDLHDLVLEQKMKSVLPRYLQELRGKADIKPLGNI